MKLLLRGFVPHQGFLKLQFSSRALLAQDLDVPLQVLSKQTRSRRVFD